MEENYFIELNKINVNDHTESKNGLTYLSWAWAVAEVSKKYPNMVYEVCKFDNGHGVLVPYMYDENTGYMCMTKVTIDGVTKEMWLPVMDNNNNAMKNVPYTIQTKYKTTDVKPATMFDVNKTIMRCLTKNLAMFGLGLYIYAGEDLPEEDNSGVEDLKNEIKSEKAKATRELNKKVAEYNKSDDGLEMRYKNMYKMITGMKQINQYKEDELMKKITALLNDLHDAKKQVAYDTLNKLVNDKMLKEEPDEIPVDICEKEIKPTDYLNAG